jgi:hypothetical protein
MENIMTETNEQRRQKIQKEVDDNYTFFKTKLSDLLLSNLGQYVLLHNCQIIDFFDTFNDAKKYADAIYIDHIYSIQKIEYENLNLGYIGTQINA